MNQADARLWAAAVAAFVGGDYVTTKAGLEREGVEEAHPVADTVMGALGPDAGMATGKAAVVGAAAGGYWYANQHSETQEYRQLFPMFLLAVGLAITDHNLRVIASA